MDAGHAPLINEGIWVAIPLLSLSRCLEKAGAALAAMFDSRADEIRSTLEEARTLRDQAQSELKKYQKLNREAAAEAEQITANAMAAARPFVRMQKRPPKHRSNARKIRLLPRSRRWKPKSSVSCVSVLPNWLPSRSFADHRQLDEGKQRT